MASEVPVSKAEQTRLAAEEKRIRAEAKELQHKAIQKRAKDICTQQGWTVRQLASIPGHKECLVVRKGKDSYYRALGSTWLDVYATFFADHKELC